MTNQMFFALQCVSAIVGIILGILIIVPMLSWLHYRDYPRLGDKWWLIKDIWKDVKTFFGMEEQNDSKLP